MIVGYLRKILSKSALWMYQCGCGLLNSCAGYLHVCGVGENSLKTRIMTILLKLRQLDQSLYLSAGNFHNKIGLPASFGVACMKRQWPVRTELKMIGRYCTPRSAKKQFRTAGATSKTHNTPSSLNKQESCQRRDSPCSTVFPQTVRW